MLRRTYASTFPLSGPGSMVRCGAMTTERETEREVKKALMSLMGNALDETHLESGPFEDSFVEQYADVIHVEAAGRAWYFRVRLEAVDEAACDIAARYEPE